jgi:hypothetical protein
MRTAVGLMVTVRAHIIGKNHIARELEQSQVQF